VVSLQNFGSPFFFPPGPLYSDAQLHRHLYLASHTVDLAETKLNTITERITVSTAFGIVHLCCCWLVLRIGWNQPAATSVDNIRSCSCSDTLLMMGENIARNM